MSLEYLENRRMTKKDYPQIGTAVLVTTHTELGDIGFGEGTIFAIPKMPVDFSS